MTTHSRYSSIEIKVGIFLTFSLALFVGMLFNFGKFFVAIGRERIEILVAFEDIGGLRIDAPVRYNGMEIGRAKWMRVLHLDDSTLERLPVLTRRDLHNLPLRPEKVFRALRDCPEADFPSLMKQTLKGRTMIELGLEVLQEGDACCYRVDDQIRVVSTVFGDTAVEIVSGVGKIIPEKSKNLLLGTSGDFFTNLARSMGEVKEILFSVTDIIGVDEKKNFDRAQARFAPMSEKLDQIFVLANRRAALTTKKFDTLSDDLKTSLNRLQTDFKKIQPQLKDSSERISVTMTKIQTQIDEVRTQADKSFSEITVDKNAIQKDVTEIMDKNSANFEKMKSNLNGVYEELGGLSSHIDGMRTTAGRLIEQSSPEMTRAGRALKNALLYLQQTGQAALENKDLMISTKDVGEHETATAVMIYRDLAMAVRRTRDALAEIQESVRAVDENDTSRKDTRSYGVYGDANSGLLSLPHAQLTMNKLRQMLLPLESVRDAVEQKMIPPYDRKKAALKENVLPSK